MRWKTGIVGSKKRTVGVMIRTVEGKIRTPRVHFLRVGGEAWRRQSEDYNSRGEHLRARLWIRRVGAKIRKIGGSHSAHSKCANLQLTRLAAGGMPQYAKPRFVQSAHKPDCTNLQF